MKTVAANLKTTKISKIPKNSIEKLESVHISIFRSIVKEREFEEEFYEEWFEFFNDLKDHLFVAICSKEFSTEAIEIAKKFFDFEKIRNPLLDVSEI